MVNDSLEAKLLGQEWFNQSQTRGAPGVDSLQSGTMGRVMGMGFSASTNFPVFSWTAGTTTGTTDNGAGANNLVGATTLTIAGGAGAVVAGDHVKIAGVRRPLRAASGGATTGAATIDLVDPITEIIPDGAAVTIVSAGNTVDVQGAIFDDKSMGVAMPLLDQPSDKPSSIISDNGYSIRVVMGYDMKAKTDMLSLDLLIGAEAYDQRRITLLGDY